MNPAFAAALALLGGCANPEYVGTGTDASVTIEYQRFSPTTWSVSHANNHSQLSVSDLTTTAACTASTDHSVQLGSPGSQLLINISTGPNGPCEPGNFDLRSDCPQSLGTADFVPVGCAYYRRWDASGQLEGALVNRTGSILIGGSAASCTWRVNAGFLGATFDDMLTFNFTAGSQPWCQD